MGILNKLFNNSYVKPQASEPPVGKYNFHQWDEPDFILPDELKLDENSSLADALKVFWSAGGLDFFNVIEAEYYSDNWLEFIGSLYSCIEDGNFSSNERSYKVPLPNKTKQELLERGVPEVFLTDL